MEIYLRTVSNSGLFTLNFRALLHMISTVEFNWKSVYSNKAVFSVHTLWKGENQYPDKSLNRLRLH